METESLSTLDMQRLRQVAFECIHVDGALDPRDDWSRLWRRGLITTYWLPCSRRTRLSITDAGRALLSPGMHPDSWPALAMLAGGDGRKHQIAWHLHTLLRVRCGNSEGYASIVQAQVEAARALVAMGAPHSDDDHDVVIAWARAELASKAAA